MVIEKRCFICAELIVDKLSKLKVRKYCSVRCAGIATSKRQTDIRRKPVIEIRTCLDCTQPFETRRRSHKVRKFCQACANKRKGKHREISDQTKGSLFANRSNWQSARSAIQKHARKTFARSGLLSACIVCGYDKHTEVCHIKAVSAFPDNTPVATINSITNLVALCPNHHWEFDNGMLQL